MATGTSADLIERNNWPEHFETTVEALGHTWITRNDRFFVRSHFPVPDVNPETWKLEVTGLVNAPLTLTLAQLEAMPATEQTVTLECAGNGRALYKLPSTSGTQWERGAVSNATWGGVLLGDLLRRAGAKPEAQHVWFEAADMPPHPSIPPFLRSIPLAKAMRDVLLAHSMNGQPLPKLNGGPLRAIVPAWYGMASTKWLTRVRVEAASSDNHFMVKGYRYTYPGAESSPPVEDMVIKSLITQPLDGATVKTGKVRVQGFAWGGIPGVRLVEISSDDGASWRPAGFMGQTAPHAWRMFATEIEVKTPATVTVLARATDSAGITQPTEAKPNAGGYANNSIHRVRFRVRA